MYEHLIEVFLATHSRRWKPSFSFFPCLVESQKCCKTTLLLYRNRIFLHFATWNESGGAGGSCHRLILCQSFVRPDTCARAQGVSGPNLKERSAFLEYKMCIQPGKGARILLNRLVSTYLTLVSHFGIGLAMN
jgi:hypothetical protein